MTPRSNDVALASCLFAAAITAVIATVGLALFPNQVVAQTVGGQITGVVVAARIDARGNDQILLRTPPQVADKTIDQIEVELADKKSVEAATAFLLPFDWKMTADKKTLKFSGPPVEEDDDIAIRVGIGRWPAPRNLELRLFSVGEALFSEKLPVERLPEIKVPDTVDEVVELPEVVSPGSTIEFQPLDLKWTPRGGKWTIGGQLAWELELDDGEDGADDDDGKPGEPGGGKPRETEEEEEPIRFTVTLPYTLEPKLGLSVKYTTAWDETVVDDEAPNVSVVPQPEIDPVLPQITDCTPMAFAGDLVCVCGWFPDTQSRHSLALGGASLDAPAGASDQVVTFRLPPDQEPGRQVITGAGVSGSAEVVVVAIGGEVDQAKLMRGESTPLRLWALGTQEPVSLHLQNHTPEIVSLEGGNDQVVTTSGGSGSSNNWQGTLHAVSPGDFNLTYTLTLGRCPCSDNGQALSDLWPPGTPASDTLTSFRAARKHANDARYGGLSDADARDRAQSALDEFATTKKKLQEAIDAWNNGDTEGGIGPETARTLRRFISEYESQARRVLDTTPAPTPAPGSTPEPTPAPTPTATTGTWGTATSSTPSGTTGTTSTPGTQPPDGDDPRDTPPPTSYGEEIDGSRIGIVLTRDDNSWIPTYNGETKVTAKIYQPHPTRARVWIASATRRAIITTRFVRRSNEPGRDLNTILNSHPETSPDVLFKRDKNPRTRCSEDPVGTGYFGSCTTVSPENEYKFTITSEDYGSFSALEATCPDCVPLVPAAGLEGWGDQQLAVEEVNREKRLVLVPKDGNRNQISDGYRPDQLWTVDAREDRDDFPKGNGTRGDGFSAYEEYRGFHNRDRKHIRTSWNTKDLFLENSMRFRIGLFMKASQLHVHEITVDQHKKRQINFNSNHAHEVDQHGLVMLARYTSSDNLGGEVTDFGPPKNVDEVKIYLRNFFHYQLGGQIRGISLEGTVAHELGHAVAIRHHGDTSTWKETWYPLGGWSELSPVHNTHNRPILCGVRLPGEVLFGHKHNQSSGDLPCIMRYRGHGDAFKQEDGTIDCAGTPPARAKFCDSKAGTAWNAGNRVAGDATRGDCKGQLLVNDK